MTRQQHNALFLQLHNLNITEDLKEIYDTFYQAHIATQTLRNYYDVFNSMKLGPDSRTLRKMQYQTFLEFKFEGFRILNSYVK